MSTAVVPRLDGVLSTDESDLAAAAVDFGNWIHSRPLAVLHPASAADIAAIVRFGRDQGLVVVPRGSGNSVGGQSQIRNGISVSMRSLAAIHRCGHDEISVQAGASWRAVVAVTLPDGLVPPVLPDYLELTVGGTLSAGGIGGTSHRYGCQADNVRNLDVVTPAGEQVFCSPTHNAELFDAVRGSQGEHGIITRATLTLIPAPTTVRRYLLSYHDLGAFLADQRRLIADRRFDSVLGQARHAGAAGWEYVTEVVQAQPPARPTDDELLRDLCQVGEYAETIAYRDFLHRLDPLVADQRKRGSWHHPHPRCNVLLPGRYAAPIIARMLDETRPEDIGNDGSVLIYAIPTERLVAPNMPKPADPLTVVFGLQRTAPPGDLDTLRQMQDDNSILSSVARLLGGAGYSDVTDYHRTREGRPA
jgi:FAD/FMN-containing dehydrogenase